MIFGPFSSDLISAVITFPIHHTDISAACGASPLLFLLLEPWLYADFFDASQIFDEAHVIVPDMTCVEFLKIGAGEILAFKAERDVILSYQHTVSLDPGAVLILYTAPLASMFEIFLLQQSFGPCQVMPARTAVESAGARHVYVVEFLMTQLLLLVPTIFVGNYGLFLCV